MLLPSPDGSGNPLVAMVKDGFIIKCCLQHEIVTYSRTNVETDTESCASKIKNEY
jgi:hypothetical protein